MSRFRLPAPLRILLIAAAVFYGVFIARTGFRTAGRATYTLIDDAMISMRYAQHLASGNGFVWNVGEAPVEGFTNLGWTLVMAGLHLLPFTFRTISLAVMILAAILLMLNLVVVYSVTQELAPKSRMAPLIAAGITAFYFPLVFWSLRGMEVGLLALLVNTATLLAFRSNGIRGGALLGSLLAAAILVRLDAILQVTVIVSYLLLARRMNRSTIAVAAGAALVSLAAVLAFQKLYFGDLLPNTYYLKMVGTASLERVKNGLLVFNLYAARDVVPLLLVSAVGLWLKPRTRTLEAAVLGALLVIQCAYSIWAGGDYAEPEVAAANRFITQGMPALFVLFGLACESAVAGSLRGSSSLGSPALVSSVLALSALWVISGTPWFSWAVDNAPLLKADIRRVRAGLAIAANTAPETTIAVHAAGQIPYFSGRRTIDLLGLNDAKIAKGPRTGPFYPGHDKWNYEYSIGQLRPDLIADNWIRLSEYIRNRTDYRELSNGMYIRIDSTRVDEPGLTAAFP